MANIFLIVEGQTEEQFYKKLLQGAYIHPDGNYRHYFDVRIIPGKRGVYARSNSGGRVSFDSCVDIVKRFLSGAAHCERVVLILDYYGLDKTFRSHLTREHRSLEDKITAIQERLENLIGNPRFRFRLQIHEFEAYLFSDPQKVVQHFGKPERLAEVEAVLKRFGGNPEAINDHVDTAPAKRLSAIFPTFSKGKTSDGLPISEKTGIPKIREKCLKFNEMCKLFDELN